jgi:hypothetical protein
VSSVLSSKKIERLRNISEVVRSKLSLVLIFCQARQMRGSGVPGARY